MRLIDADRLTSEMQKLLTNNDTLIDEWLSDRVIEEIEDAPTIEAGQISLVDEINDSGKVKVVKTICFQEVPNFTRWKND